MNVAVTFGIAHCGILKKTYIVSQAQHNVKNTGYIRTKGFMYVRPCPIYCINYRKYNRANTSMYLSSN